MAKPVVAPEKCNGSQACVGVCPTEAISVEKGGVAVIRAEACVECGDCVPACPTEAISIEK